MQKNGWHQISMTKPYSQACENNKQPIIEQLTRHFAECTRVLEIGSGSGQHAVHFASHLSHLVWQTSDQDHYHYGINLWIDEHPAPNLLRPITFTVGADAFPAGNYDGVFTANTAHIMQKHEVQHLMSDVSTHLLSGGLFCQYGPFIENGKFSSQSNEDFHYSLLERGYGGYRSIEELQAWQTGLTLTQKIAMPANNLMLVWKKLKTR